VATDMTKRLFRNTTATLAASLALVAGAVACNNGDSLTAVNQNPNNPEDAPAGAVFTNAVQVAVGRWLGSGYSETQTELIAQHLAKVQYPDEDRYTRIRAGDTQGYFTSATTGAYAVSLEDFEQVIKKGTATGSPAIAAPASIMQQWEFSYLTNSWGDVPYSEALKGDAGTVLPAYDAQKDIYAGMFAKLTKASADLALASTKDLGGADPLYGGSTAKWAKFANSLRARLAMNLMERDPATANTQLTAALAAGVFASNADNAVLEWPGDGNFDNSWATNFKTRDDHRISKTLMDILLANNDPRTPIWAQPTADFSANKAGAEKYAGAPNGQTASIAGTFLSSTSRPGEFIYPGVTSYGTYGGSGAKAPSYLMTYSELNFIKAEAAERAKGGLTPAAAASYYYAGIRASMEQWGVADADITAYLAQPGVVYTPGTPGLKQIATQKWLALFMDGGNAWFEWRRTCQPSTIKAGPAADQIAAYNGVMRRFEYPTAEISVNGANVDAAVKRQGADDRATKIYIDAQSPACS
jgi:hypothetical protein